MSSPSINVGQATTSLQTICEFDTRPIERLAGRRNKYAGRGSDFH